jgi:hypothetical protein
VKELYQAIYNKPFAYNYFQKDVRLNLLERLAKKFTGEAKQRSKYLYQSLTFSPLKNFS